MRGWPVTVQTAHGERGPVAVLSTTIDRRQEAGLHREVATIDPSVLRRAEDLRRPPVTAPRPAEVAG